MTEGMDWSEVRFREIHAISDTVWIGRGYVRYQSGAAGASDLLQIDPGYSVLTSRALRHRTQSPGLAILRRSLPGTSGPTPLAELRPDVPVVMGRRSHKHEGGEVSHEHDSAWPFDPGGRTGHHHLHETRAKYLFAPGQATEYVTLAPTLTGTSFFRALAEAERVAEDLSASLGFDIEAPRRREVLEKLLGQRLAARPRATGHARSGSKTRIALPEVLVRGRRLTPTSELRRSRSSEARRIDIHPAALSRASSAERVFFVMEGCIKADSVLTAILDASDPATVVSVPSVTLWPKDWTRSDGDLAAFTRLASDKEVVLVVDSDWDDYARNRGCVYTQAARLQDRLQRSGLTRVAIAVPSSEPAPCDLHGVDAGSKRGVDDFLADGALLGDLRIVEPRDTGTLLAALRDSDASSSAGLGSILVAAHQLALRSRPDSGVVRASAAGLARILSEELEGPFVGPSRARLRQAARVSAALQNTRIGIEIRGGGTNREYRLPLLRPPRVLGTLRDVGVAALSPPNLSPLRTCLECGQPLEGSARRNAKLHPLCAHRRRSRAYRARQRDA